MRAALTTAFEDEQRPIVAEHLRKCAEAQQAGVFEVDATVTFDDHGEQRPAVVASVERFEDGRLRGYMLDVTGFGPKPVRLFATAFEVR